MFFLGLRFFYLQMYPHLLLSLVPPPQVTEQEDHDSHSLTSQSTKKQYRLNSCTLRNVEKIYLLYFFPYCPCKLSIIFFVKVPLSFFKLPGGLQSTVHTIFSMSSIMRNLAHCSPLFLASVNFSLWKEKWKEYIQVQGDPFLVLLCFPIPQVSGGK